MNQNHRPSRTGAWIHIGLVPVSAVGLGLYWAISFYTGIRLGDWHWAGRFAVAVAIFFASSLTIAAFILRPSVEMVAALTGALARTFAIVFVAAIVRPLFIITGFILLTCVGVVVVPLRGAVRNPLVSILIIVAVGSLAAFLYLR